MVNSKTQLTNNEIYHVIVRAVGNSVVFKNKNDYYRGIFSIYEFNNANPVEIWKRRRDRIVEKRREKFGGGPTSPEPRGDAHIDERNKFIEILAFCFMPNHIHLLVRQLRDNGTSKFMQKVGTGYAVYFNKKYKRKGHLFNRFKAIHIADDNQLITVFNYIHANPISLIEPGWKEKGITDSRKVIKFLENEYRWSSLFDYLGKNNFASVTSRDFLLELMGGEGGCRTAVNDWIKHKKVFGDFFFAGFE